MDRELLVSLVEEGYSTYQLAKKFNKGQTTIRYWLLKFGLKTKNKSLEFHHTDPSKKSKNYNKRFKAWSFDRQKKELEHCIIVCSNCHREIHDKTVF